MKDYERIRAVCVHSQTKRKKVNESKPGGGLHDHANHKGWISCTRIDIVILRLDEAEKYAMSCLPL